MSGTERFGRYVLGRELGSGGMASVHLAVVLGDEGFSRTCAIKRIHPHLARDLPFVNMFLDEARIASRIHHPNVCQVFDFGRVGERLYLAMEYLCGRSVVELLKALSECEDERVLAALPAMVAHIVAEACDGLHAAHELVGDDGMSLEVVHRDVSPQNLFLTFDGAVKVVDFGVAKARAQRHETAAGEVKGKLAYMAPEQLEGIVDRRVDVWALGVVLWELLAVERLFRRETHAEIAAAISRANVPPPSSVRAGVPPSLDAVALRALSADRAARYPTARAMAEALRAAIPPSEEPIGRSALASWLARVFPKGADETRRLSHEVAVLERSEALTLAGPLPASEPDGRSITAAPATLEAGESVPVDLSMGDDDAPRRSRAVVPAIAVLVAIALALGVALMSSDAPAPVARAGEPASAAPRDTAPETERVVAEPDAVLTSVAPAPVPEPREVEPAAPEPHERPRYRPRPTSSASRPTTTTSAPAAAPEPEERGEGTLRIGGGVTLRIDGEVIEGPRTHRLPTGRYRAVIERPGGDVTTEEIVVGRDRDLVFRASR